MINKKILGFLMLLIAIGGCSKFRKIQKSGDWELQFNSAVEYYEAKDYHRAVLLFENILPIMRGTEQAELGNLYLAYSYFHQDQYILSAHHFEEFVRIYGRSQYVMEAAFMHIQSLYYQSPHYELDQTVTYEALEKMQNFINRYPDSEYATLVDENIDIMQQKLEKKAYENCKLYYKTKNYKAALVVYESFKNKFPDSRYNEEVNFLKIETTYVYAEKSIFSKQKERYQNCIDHYLAFIDKYPNSKFIGDSEKIYVNCIKKISKFASTN